MRALEGAPIAIPASLAAAINSQDAVDQPPHNYYRYPARFSPDFARECIKAFTAPGDTVVDPFCGGGTAILEAMVLGRRAVGFDISTLATFLSKTKATPLSIHDLRSLETWTTGIAYLDKTYPWEKNVSEDLVNSQLRNLPELPMRFFSATLDHIEKLSSDRQKNFARLALLGIGQNSLDCRKRLPVWSELRDSFIQQNLRISREQYFFMKRAAAVTGVPVRQLKSMRRIIARTSEHLDVDRRVPESWLPAKLVLTSPPYPGVHVLYHRWQIEGRKETPTPFWLAGSNDGQGAAFYTLGGRTENRQTRYYNRLIKVFSAVRNIVGPKSLVVQLVAFASPEWQLPAYLQCMQQAGFDEATPISNDSRLFNGRIYRHVPGRKWYAWNRGKTHGSREVLLIHTPRA